MKNESREVTLMGHDELNEFYEEEDIEEIKQLEVGTIYTVDSTLQAITEMATLHEHGIETCLYSYHNGAFMKSFKIIHIPEGYYENE